MNDTAPIRKVEAEAGFGSDAVAQLLRALDIPYIALTPGASFRGLHDSLVNFLGNTRPEMLLCIHEENAVALAHGYARVTGRAARGRAARERRPDARDDGDLQRVVRPHPDRHARRRRAARRGEAAAVGRLDPHLARPGRAHPRLHQVGRPAGLGAGGARVDRARASHRDDAAARTDVRRARRRPAGGSAGGARADAAARRASRCRSRASPSPQAVREAVDAARRRREAAAHDRPRVEQPSRTWNAASRSPSASARSCSPTSRPARAFRRAHPRHPFPPSLYVTGAATQRDPRRRRDPEPRLDRPRRHAAPGVRRRVARRAKVISCSLDEYVHNGWNMDYQALPPADLAILASPDALRRGAARCARSARLARARAVARPACAGSRGRRRRERLHAARGDGARHDRGRSRRTTLRTSACRSAGRASSAASRIRWTTSASTAAAASAPDRAWRSARRSRCAAAIACRSRCWATAITSWASPRLWTGVHYKVPVLIVVANNQSFFNDELHQERVARMRGRPVENRMDRHAHERSRVRPRGTRAQPGRAGHRACAHRGRARSQRCATASTPCAQVHVFVIDVRVAPEYSRAAGGRADAPHPPALMNDTRFRRAARSTTAARWHESQARESIPVIAPATGESLGNVDRRVRRRRRPRGEGRTRRVSRVARHAGAGAREGGPRGAAQILLDQRRRARVARSARHRQSVPGDALRRRDQRRLHGVLRGARHRDQGRHDPDRPEHAQLHAARAARRGRAHRRVQPSAAVHRRQVRRAARHRQHAGREARRPDAAVVAAHRRAVARRVPARRVQRRHRRPRRRRRARRASEGRQDRLHRQRAGGPRGDERRERDAQGADARARRQERAHRVRRRDARGDRRRRGARHELPLRDRPVVQLDEPRVPARRDLRRGAAGDREEGVADQGRACRPSATPRCRASRARRNTTRR